MTGQSVEGSTHHIVGLTTRSSSHPRHTGDVEESGLRRARTDRRDSHPGAVGLGPQRLREGQHERLRCRVGGELGDGLEGSGGGDIDDRPLLGRGHARQQQTAQMDDGLTVDLHLRGLTNRVGLGDPASCTEPSVVDEGVDDDAAPGDVLHQGQPLGCRGDVAGTDDGADPVSGGEFGGKVVEDVLTASGQDEIGSAAGQVTAECLPQATTGPAHQCPRAFVASRILLSHVTSLPRSSQRSRRNI